MVRCGSYNVLWQVDVDSLCPAEGPGCEVAHEEEHGHECDKDVVEDDPSKEGKVGGHRAAKAGLDLDQVLDGRACVVCVIRE